MSNPTFTQPEAPAPSALAAVPLAEVTRSGRKESVHFGHVVICDAQGTVVQAWGDPETKTYMRSSAKPLQALTCLTHRTDDAFDWTDRHRAITCASHSSEDFHRQTVADILQRARVTENDLRCGPHRPINGDVADQLIRDGKQPTSIFSNCSGKHSGMLACCQAMQWPIDSYWQPDHPLQQDNIARYARWGGLEQRQVSTGLDGCGVPTFFVPLRSMATAFARLGAVFHARSASFSFIESDAELDAACRVMHAMKQHPEMVAGTGRLDTLLGTTSAGQAISKGGAEGLFCLSLPHLGLGLALKIADGSGRPIPAVVLPFLETWLPQYSWSDLRDPLDLFIKNTRHQPVGDIHSVLEMN